MNGTAEFELYSHNYPGKVCEMLKLSKVRSSLQVRNPS